MNNIPLKFTLFTLLIWHFLSTVLIYDWLYSQWISRYIYSHVYLSWIPIPSRSILTSKSYVTSSLKLWSWLFFFTKPLLGFAGLTTASVSQSYPIRMILFQLPSLSRLKSNLVYCLHPLEGWTVLEVLFAVISTGRKEGKFQGRKRTAMHFLLFPLFLSCVFLSKGRTSAGSWIKNTVKKIRKPKMTELTYLICSTPTQV